METALYFIAAFMFILLIAFVSVIGRAIFEYVMYINRPESESNISFIDWLKENSNNLKN